MDDEAGRARQTSGCERSLFFIRKSQKPLGGIRWGRDELRSVCFRNLSHSGKEPCLSGETGDLLPFEEG